MVKQFSWVLIIVFLVSFTTSNDERINKRNFYKRNKNKMILDGCFEFRPCAKLGRRHPTPSSCRAILKNDRSAPSGPYSIQTGSTITKVYCYMKNIPGCGGGGWTTVMKIDGSKKTFKFDSSLWSNKTSYHVIGGQSGTDEQETKLPTYWTLPFTKLCLGMKTKTNQQPKWISVKYQASSLYSVIADGKYRSLSIGRGQWKSLIAGSSLQSQCDREGFNPRATAYNERVRIGIISGHRIINRGCTSSSSAIGFGVYVMHVCAPKMTTGNCARHSADNGDATIPAYGYILAQ